MRTRVITNVNYVTLLNVKHYHQYYDAVNRKRTEKCRFNGDADFTLAFSRRCITPLAVVAFDDRL